ncbi:2-amino-4-hydroxy-6-hydroxymethyldihydropteridine pyrophosphokinase [Microbulbifer aestuariivivens]|uniref:2-amino-4-hydroxy-6-hydroxymethyldihydropteridine pyrophosphokinase n=1 Tax=Microbulbifer aestuariivivens TaxID=1908308 RepID=A0ABP9WQM6_9GAMM
MTGGVFIGLGSNLQQPEQQLRSALAEMAAIPQTQLLRCSGFYRSAPVGPGEQPDYINAVAELESALSATALLEALQGIEDRHGRKRLMRWGARTLDLDILLFGRETVDSDSLQIPHPRIGERNFVLVPLAELAPDLKLPGGEPIRELLRRCPQSRLERLN